MLIWIQAMITDSNIEAINEPTARVKTTSKATRHHRRITKRKAIRSEIWVAKSVELGSKFFFDSIKWLKSRLNDPLGRIPKVKGKSPSPRALADWIQSYFSIESEAESLQFTSRKSVSQRRLGKLPKRGEIARACRKNQTNRAPGPNGTRASGVVCLWRELTPLSDYTTTSPNVAETRQWTNQT